MVLIAAGDDKSKEEEKKVEVLNSCQLKIK